MEATQPVAAAQQIDLQPFCDDDPHGRYNLCEPWVFNGKRIATDGRVLVVVPAPGEPDYDRNERGRLPNVFDVIPPISSSRDGDWLPWPPVEPCRDCQGTLKVHCESCGGDGQCNLCKCEAEHKCGYCDGTGNVRCKDCQDVGSFDHRFGLHILARRYAYLVSKLPSVEYLPTLKADESIVRFRFAGGEGAVSPLRED